MAAEPIQRQILVIEYFDGIPGSVVALEHWDHTREPWFRPGRDQATGWCPQHYEFALIDGQLYWHNSGGGGTYEEHSVNPMVRKKPVRAALWAAPGVRLVTWKSNRWPRVPVTDAQLLRMGHRRLEEPLELGHLNEGVPTTDPFAVAEEAYYGFLYCQVCGEMVDRSEDHPCPHLSWCEAWSEYAGCGQSSSEEAHRASFLRLLAALAALPGARLKGILRALKKCRLRVRCACFGWDVKDGERLLTHLDSEERDALEGDESLEAGRAWVASLDGLKTKAAYARTLKWVNQWRARRAKGAKSCKS